MTYMDGDIVERINLALKEYQTIAKPSNRSCVIPRVLDNVVGDDVEGVVHVLLETDPGLGDYGAFIDCLRRNLGECAFTMDDEVSGRDDGQKTISITVRKPRISCPTQHLQKNANTHSRAMPKKSTGGCCCVCVAMISFLLIAMAAALCLYVALRGKDGLSLETCVENVLKILKIGKNTSEL